jgi:hypothetical protein
VPRGHTDVLYKDDQILVAWKDNKGVYMASNKFGGDTINNCLCFCRTERKLCDGSHPHHGPALQHRHGGRQPNGQYGGVLPYPISHQEMVVPNLHLEFKCECRQGLEVEDVPDRSQRTTPELPARAVHRHADGAWHKARQEEVCCWQCWGRLTRGATARCATSRGRLT